MLPLYNFVFHSLSSAFFGVTLGSSGYISSLKQEPGATFQLLGISLAAGTLSRGVVLSHYAVFSFGQNLTAPCRFVSTKPFWCWSTVSVLPGSVTALFCARSVCPCLNWHCLWLCSRCLGVALARFALLCTALARFGFALSRYVCLNFALSCLNFALS